MREQLGGRVAGRAARLGRLADGLDAVRARRGVRRACRTRSALAPWACASAQAITSSGSENAVALLGQPVGPEQPLARSRAARSRDQLPPARARRAARELARAESVLGGAGAPVLAQPGEVDVLLALARLDRGDLGGAEAAVAVLGHVLDDLRPPRSRTRAITSRGTPSSSAMPFVGVSHSTPSERVSSARRWAW